MQFYYTSSRITKMRKTKHVEQFRYKAAGRSTGVMNYSQNSVESASPALRKQKVRAWANRWDPGPNLPTTLKKKFGNLKPYKNVMGYELHLCFNYSNNINI